MNIVITDGFTLNPGDLSWEPLSSLGRVTHYDRTNPGQLIGRCIEAEIVVTNKTPIPASAIDALPSLKMIAVTATGYNVVDIMAAKRKGIVVSNVPVYGTHSVAQHAFALLLELTNHVGSNSDSVFRGDWFKAPDWCYSKSPIIEINGKTLGIVGYGRIGRQTAAIAKAFDMKVIFHDPLAKGEENSTDILELFRQSDFISLHCPLTPDNKEFVNTALLNVMKPSAFLINTSRGQLICEPDLAAALKSNRIAGAALDVLSVEPPLPSHPLIGLPNCLVTPHNAWLSLEARRRILNTTVENISAMMQGKPINIV